MDSDTGTDRYRYKCVNIDRYRRNCGGRGRDSRNREIDIDSCPLVRGYLIMDSHQ